MPKDKQKSVTVFTVQSSISRGAQTPLNSTERDEFRKAVDTPGFKRALQNAFLAKPSVYSGSGRAGEYSTLANNNVLQILRGWEMFENALFSQLDAQAQKLSQPLTESYPDAGQLGADKK